MAKSSRQRAVQKKTGGKAPRRVAPPVKERKAEPHQRVCPECRTLFHPKRADARTCGPTCRQKRSRRARSMTGVKGLVKRPARKGGKTHA